jgi:hypothetical protein
MRYAVAQLVFLVVGLAACEGPSPTELTGNDSPLFASGEATAGEAVCHLRDGPMLGQVMTVNPNALPDHLSHGDCRVSSGLKGESCSCPIRIEADIDGRSQLILSPGSAQWHHYDYAAPGRLVDVGFCGRPQMTLPTIIDGIEWYPEWPDAPTEENRDCNCLSDSYEGIERRIPPGDLTPVLQRIQHRWPPAIVQYPTEANGYTTIIEFNDNGYNCAATYVVELSFE